MPLNNSRASSELIDGRCAGAATAPLRNKPSIQMEIALVRLNYGALHSEETDYSTVAIVLVFFIFASAFS